MSKLDVALQEPVYSTVYRVIYGDTDAAGVVYNANYLRYFEIARTEMMREAGMSYRAIEDLDCILPVTETYLRFKAPAHYDDLLQLSASLAEISRVSCRFHYAIHKDETNGRRSLLVKGFTTHACVSRQGKLTPFPAEVMEVITSLLGKSDTVQDKG